MTTFIYGRVFILLFFSLFSISNSLHSKEAFNNNQKDLPIPFSYEDKLYLEVSSGTFFGFENKIHPHYVPGYNIENRGYRFLSNAEVDTNPKNFTKLKGTTLILCEVEATCWFCSHFFHLLEHIVGIWSLYGNKHWDDVRHIIIAGDGNHDTGEWKGPNSINKHLIRALFPNAKVQNWVDFKKENTNKIVRFKKVLISDRAASFTSPACVKINKMLGAALPELDPEALSQLGIKVNLYAQTPERTSKSLTVTYLKRSPPRCLGKEIENQMIQKISALPNVELKVADFAEISFIEQINIIGNTDVLISVHGNGLSHILFLPRSSCAIEIFPPDALLIDYRLFADARGLDYFGIMSNKGIVDRSTAYEIGQVGNTNAPIPYFDIDLVVSIIESRS